MSLQDEISQIALSLDVADPNRERLRALAQRVGDLEGPDFDRGFRGLASRSGTEAMYVQAHPSRLSSRQRLSFGGDTNLQGFVSRLMELGARAEQESARLHARHNSLVRVARALPRPG